MIVSHDYTELINDLKEEIGYGNLILEYIIQVERSDKEIETGYSPIIDWYYSPESMEEIMIDNTFDSEDDLFEKKGMREQYASIKSRLILMSVGEVLSEIEERNKVIR